MLEAIELENFKAFGERTRIEFAPITLIVGENSAGKSSIVQALNLLKQTRESRRGALLLPRTENGIVDLGSYNELLFDHDLKRDLALRVDFTPGPHDGYTGTDLWEKDSNIHALAFEMHFTRSTEQKKEILLKSLTVHTYEAPGKTAVFEPIAVFEPNDEDMFSIASSVASSVPVNDLTYPREWESIGFRAAFRAAKCQWVTDSRDLWARLYDLAQSHSKEIVDLLQGDKSRFVEEHDKEVIKRASEFDRAIAFYSTDFDLRSFIDRMRASELKEIIALDGFAPIPLRSHTGRERLPEHEIYYPEEIIPFVVLDVGWLATDCGKRLGHILSKLYPMGAYRRPAERWYISTGTTPEDVGYHGDMLPDLLYRRPELVHETNKWLDRLQIGYHINVQAVGTRSGDLFEIRLIDTRRGVDVALSDVGFGVTQILPLVVQSLAGEGQIITIEQPEVHVHPKLQADLGNLFAEAIRSPRNHRFIIETHSEHLVLRMQRLIREKKTSAGGRLHHLRVSCETRLDGQTPAAGYRRGFHR